MEDKSIFIFSSLSAVWQNIIKQNTTTESTECLNSLVTYDAIQYFVNMNPGTKSTKHLNDDDSITCNKTTRSLVKI